MFEIFSLLFFLVFFMVFGIILVTMIRGIKQWNQNNHSPRLTVDATVVTKRMQVTHHNGRNSMPRSTTTYFVTFQVESGDRMELHVAGQEYGLLIEGDRGQLTFQGTRYLGFSRN